MKSDRSVRLLRDLTILFAAASIIFLMLVIHTLYERGEAARSLEESAVPAVQAAAIPAPAPTFPVYTVWLSGQELRLTTPDDPNGYTVLHSIDTRTLRSADRSALEHGVRLESREAVVRFLEDFSS